MKKRIIKKQKKNGLSRNSLVRINKDIKQEISRVDRCLCFQEKELDRAEKEIKESKESYEDFKNCTARKMESQMKIIEKLKQTIEEGMNKRFYERIQAEKLKEELHSGIKTLQDENAALKIELLTIRQKEESSGAIKKTMRKVFNL